MVLRPPALAGSTRFAILAAMTAGLCLAQDTRPSDVARRLHEIVDQKIEALRAELHREIDAAMRDDSDTFRSMTLKEVRELPAKTPQGLTLASEPASTEFHELHRLFPLTARRVAAVAPGSEAERLGIREGDMFLGPTGLTAKNPKYQVIRRHEFLYPAVPQTEETASQMVDRMWDEAVRNAMKSGFEAVRTDQPGPDSRPVRK